jgi:hypothetical protein
MTYEIPAVLLEEIAKLPPEIQALKDKYPLYVANIAEFYFEPPLEIGYEPNDIDFFYDDASEPEMFILGGFLESLEPRKPNPDHSVTAIRVDGEWVYIEIEGRVLLDRRGGMIMPDLKVDETQAALFKAAAKSILALDNWQLDRSK